jgi:glycerate dehydrogenase
MKIVVLDGHTLNPGDLDWAPLKELAHCVCIYPRTAPNEILDRARDAQIVLTNKTSLTAETIAALPQLRYIGLLSTGCNSVDLKAAQEQEILVANAPGYATASVAQLAFSLLLELVQQVGHHSAQVKAGVWHNSPDFTFFDPSLRELAGKTLGIVGFGAIGRQIARIAKAFDMRVLVNTLHPEQYQRDYTCEFIDIDRLFSEAEIISLNVPLTDQTRQLVNTARLARIKQGALLINTGRGQLIDEEAVTEALEEGYLGGYATDVLEIEPPVDDNPLFSAPNCVITPHLAWATCEARQRLLDLTVANVAAFLRGEPQNLVY